MAASIAPSLATKVAMANFSSFPVVVPLTESKKALLSSKISTMKERNRAKGRQAQIKALTNIIAWLRDNDVETFTTEEMECFIHEFNYSNLWNLSDSPEDKLGLRRSIGDALGGHGLKTPHTAIGKVRYYFTTVK